MGYKSCGRKQNACKSKLHQDWSKVYDLKKDLSLKELQRDIEKREIKLREEVVYVYVVATTEIRNSQILQTGTGPNIEGGLITLTNCKHGMRCDIGDDIKNGINLNGEMWKIREDNVWIAGLTTRNRRKNPYGKHFLFYLMKVEEYHESFTELRRYLQNNYPNALSVKRTVDYDPKSNPLGDVYEPRREQGCNDPFDPNSYHPPHYHHPHHQCMNYRSQPNCHTSCNISCGCWRRDIAYNKCGNPPYLLTGDKVLSYVWQIPKIHLDLNCLTRLISQNKAVNRGFVESQKIIRNYVILKLSDFLDCLIKFYN